MASRDRDLIPAPSSALCWAALPALIAVCLVAATTATAEPVPLPLAERLDGCWAEPGGGRLIFSSASGHGLEVVMDGFCDGDLEPSPPTPVTHVADLGRSCFFAQLCAPESTRGYCLELTDGSEAPTLLLLRPDHRRLLRDRSRGNHPLEVFDSRPLTRCP